MRPRKQDNKWLRECGLKYVYQSKGRYYVYRPPGERERVLGRITDTRQSIILAYEQAQLGHFGTVEWLLNYYIENRPKDPQPISERTLEDYKNYRKAMTGKSKRSTETWFADTGLVQIDRYTIRQYLDNYPGKVQANRHIQLLKAAWNFAAERYPLPANPCMGVKLNHSKARDATWTRQQYVAALRVAKDMKFPFMAVFMELMYLQGARKAEIQDMKTSQILPGGLFLERKKGSQGEITQWSPRLRRVVDLALSLNKDAPAPISGEYLLHNKDGSKITESQYKNACRRIKAKCSKLGVDLSNVTFHDLKANASVDRIDGDVGHQTEKMKAVYRRTPKVTKSTK